MDIVEVSNFYMNISYLIQYGVIDLQSLNAR